MSKLEKNSYKQQTGLNAILHDKKGIQSNWIEEKREEKNPKLIDIISIYCYAGMQMSFISVVTVITLLCFGRPVIDIHPIPSFRLERVTHVHQGLLICASFGTMTFISSLVLYHCVHKIIPSNEQHKNILAIKILLPMTSILHMITTFILFLLIMNFTHKIMGIFLFAFVAFVALLCYDSLPPHLTGNPPSEIILQLRNMMCFFAKVAKFATYGLVSTVALSLPLKASEERRFAMFEFLLFFGSLMDSYVMVFSTLVSTMTMSRQICRDLIMVLDIVSIVVLAVAIATILLVGGSILDEYTILVILPEILAGAIWTCAQYSPESFMLSQGQANILWRVTGRIENALPVILIAAISFQWTRNTSMMLLVQIFAWFSLSTIAANLCSILINHHDKQTRRILMGPVSTILSPFSTV